MGQKLKISGWIALGVFAGALTTISLQTVARNSLEPLPLEELQQLAAVFGMIKSDYVEPVDDKKLITDAISGMVSSLDPHSQYFDKKSFKEFKESNAGKFVGVGIEITQEDGLVKVVSPIEDTPAFRAGIKPTRSASKLTRAEYERLKAYNLEATAETVEEPEEPEQVPVERTDEAFVPIQGTLAPSSGTCTCVEVVLVVMTELVGA